MQDDGEYYEDESGDAVGAPLTAHGKPVLLLKSLFLVRISASTEVDLRARGNDIRF